MQFVSLHERRLAGRKKDSAVSSKTAQGSDYEMELLAPVLKGISEGRTISGIGRCLITFFITVEYAKQNSCILL